MTTHAQPKISACSRDIAIVLAAVLMIATLRTCAPALDEEKTPRKPKTHPKAIYLGNPADQALDIEFWPKLTR